MRQTHGAAAGAAYNVSVQVSIGVAHDHHMLQLKNQIGANGAVTGISFQVQSQQHLTHHTSHLTPHTSHLTPHASHLTPHLLQQSLLRRRHSPQSLVAAALNRTHDPIWQALVEMGDGICVK